MSENIFRVKRRQTAYPPVYCCVIKSQEYSMSLYEQEQHQGERYCSLCKLEF